MVDRRKRKRIDFLDSDDNFISGTTVPFREFEDIYKKIKKRIRDL